MGTQIDTDDKVYNMMVMHDMLFSREIGSSEHYEYRNFITEQTGCSSDFAFKAVNRRLWHVPFTVHGGNQGRQFEPQDMLPEEELLFARYERGFTPVSEEIQGDESELVQRDAGTASNARKTD